MFALHLISYFSAFGNRQVTVSAINFLVCIIYITCYSCSNCSATKNAKQIIFEDFTGRKYDLFLYYILNDIKWSKSNNYPESSH